MRRLAIGLISLYQRVLSPYWPAACRYTPTCSHYAQEAIERHGLPTGGWMALKRLSRCQPWGAGGHDPVPPASGGPSRPEPERTGVSPTP